MSDARVRPGASDMKAHRIELVRARHQAGVGMIDVMLAVLVLAFGVLAVARLQAVALREGGGATARGLAVQLAQEKLDDLRHFTQLASATGGVYGYDEIGTNAGGREDASDALLLPSGNVTLGNTTYNRTWAAAGYYYCNTGAAPTATNCSKTRPDYYGVTVTIQWSDPDGSSRSVALSDSIVAHDPLSEASGLLSGSGTEGPIVTYNPGEAPDVIAIDVGGGTSKETTNPTPELIKHGQDVINTIARYETIRYDPDEATIEREEFLTLNCTCEQTSSGAAYDLNGNQVNKRRGVPADRFQSPICTICCRDHHDDSSCNPSTSSGKKGCYDPYRPSSDYSSNDHNHYNSAGQLANNSGDEYAEACRLKRVDGLLRVVQDWRLINLSVLPEDFFASGGTVNTTNVANYGDFVKDYVEATIRGTTVPSPIWPTSASMLEGSTKQFSARAIYLDYLDSSETSALASRLAGSDSTVFQDIPFYEVNLTKLAAWNVTDASLLAVTDQQIQTEVAGQDLYSRGLVTALDSGTANVVATAKTSNTGVFDADPIDPNDVGSLQSSIAITVTNTPPPSTLSIAGVVSPAVAETISFSATNGGVCAYTTATGSYSCDVPSGWSGRVTPSHVGYTFTPQYRDYANVTVTQTAQDFAAAAAAGTYTIQGTISGVVGASVTLSASNQPSGACSYNSAASTYSCSVPSGFTGQVSASASGYTFSPPAIQFTNVTGNFTDQNFVGSSGGTTTYTVSGSISLGAGVTGSTIGVPTITGGGSCSVDNAVTPVTYTCTVATGWSGTITPTSSAAVTFSPASKSYSNVSSNRTGENYNATIVNYTISGTISISSNSIKNKTYVMGTSSGQCTVTGSNSLTRTYSCTVSSGSSPTLTPSETTGSAQFAPASRSYSNVTANSANQNFSACPTGDACSAP
ncbi:MAG: hypothetical protein HYV18_06290 [Gammaproteobacteria bacterium]|nr:hypothetical protein [Gammaproteobacteria bacterium]